MKLMCDMNKLVLPSEIKSGYQPTCWENCDHSMCCMNFFASGKRLGKDDFNYLHRHIMLRLYIELSCGDKSINKFTREELEHEVVTYAREKFSFDLPADAVRSIAVLLRPLNDSYV